MQIFVQQANLIFDEISISKQILLEDKRASLAGLMIQATRRKITVEAAAQEWAEEQIYGKTVGRIAALATSVGTQPEEGGNRAVPCINDFRGFRKLIFRIQERDS